MTMVRWRCGVLMSSLVVWGCMRIVSDAACKRHLGEGVTGVQLADLRRRARWFVSNAVERSRELDGSVVRVGVATGDRAGSRRGHTACGRRADRLAARVVALCLRRRPGEAARMWATFQPLAAWQVVHKRCPSTRVFRRVLLSSGAAFAAVRLCKAA